MTSTISKLGETCETHPAKLNPSPPWNAFKNTAAVATEQMQRVFLLPFPCSPPLWILHFSFHNTLRTAVIQVAKQTTNKTRMPAVIELIHLLKLVYVLNQDS